MTVAASASVVPSSTPTLVAVPTPAPKFPSGIYVIRPRAEGPGGQLELIGGTLPRSLLVESTAFDVSADQVVWVGGGGTDFVVARPDGTTQRTTIKGLSGMGRPSLSPDGQRVIVQGTDVVVAPGGTPPPLGPNGNPLNSVYLVDLASGTWRRVGAAPTSSPLVQSEYPVFFPSGDRVAYWVSENNCLVIKIHDATTLAELLTIRGYSGTSGCYQPTRGVLDGVRFHTAISRDSSRIVVSGQLAVYDAKTGALVADVHQAALDGLAAAGYRPDSRFPGQAKAGTFPLAATFSPDGRQLAFDGAVEKDGTYGVILCRIDLDGGGFTILRPPVPVPAPQFTNNLNFSPLSPQWR